MSFFYNETIRRRKIRNMGKEEKMEGKKNGGKKKHCIDVWQYGKLNIKLTS